MKRILMLSLLIMGGLSLNAQSKYVSCSNAKTNGFSKKSPFLNPTQLSEQAKYDINFYQLDLKMSNTTTDLEGSVTIKGTTTQSVDSILLELYETFSIDSILLNGNNVGFNHQGFILKIAANLPTNTAFTTTIFYNGTPPSAATNPLGGSGLSHANVSAWSTEVTWSLSEPFLAYEWFPVKQILNDKADSCAVNITVANHLKAGSNGVLDSITDHGNGTSTYHWFHRHPIAYYLISVAISDYEEYVVNAFVGTPNEMPIVNYIYPGSLSNYKDDIDNTVNFIELYSNLFGMYPFVDEKYGHCLAPIGGGMEHQTMTTQSSMDATLTAHELAHQWFGDYVTCGSWSEIWLNEGFASYAEDLMIENLYPTQAMAYMVSRHNQIKGLPGGSVWVQDSTSDAAIFSSRLTYNKGAAIIHTLRYIINNDQLFFEGLRNYLSTHKNSTASVADFKSIMETTTSMNLDDFFNEWYFGEGYPIYKIKWNESEGGLLLNVKHTTSTQTTPYFSTPLELKISRFNNLPDTIIKVEVPSNDFYIHIPDFDQIKNIVKINPNNWVICKVNSISKDVNMQVSVAEIEKEDEFKIYPIPANDFLNIEADQEGKYQIEVLDDFGRILMKQAFENGYQLSTSTFSSGDYIIRITNEQSNEKIYKVIKL